MLIEVLQQKYALLHGLPFNIVDVVLNVPDDDFVNDVTVYVDKESAATLAVLSENQLVNLGHQILEDIFLQLLAPEQCSLHLVYQFFDDSVVDYQIEPYYFIGEYWDNEAGFWIAQTFLNLVYNEQKANGVLIYSSWLDFQEQEYRPLQSNLLAFIGYERCETFLNLILNLRVFAELDVQTVVFENTDSEISQCMIKTNWPTNMPERHEYKMIEYGYQLFSIFCRFPRRANQVWLTMTAGESEIVSFQKKNDQYWYRTWLDDELVMFKGDKPVVFSGPAKRKLNKYLQRLFTIHRFRLKVINIEMLHWSKWDVVITLSTLPKTLLNQELNMDTLFDVAQKAMLTIYNFYDQPNRCTLKVRVFNSNRYLLLRINRNNNGYRMTRRTHAKRYEDRFYTSGLPYPLGRRHYDRYRYKYESVLITE